MWKSTTNQGLALSEWKCDISCDMRASWGKDNFNTRRTRSWICMLKSFICSATDTEWTSQPDICQQSSTGALIQIMTSINNHNYQNGRKKDFLMKCRHCYFVLTTALFFITSIFAIYFSITPLFNRYTGASIANAWPSFFWTRRSCIV